MSTPERYHEYTVGCWYELEKSHNQISRIFILTPFATMQLYMLAFGTSDSLLKFVHQVARVQTLMHSCSIFDQRSLISKCPVGMLQDE